MTTTTHQLDLSVTQSFTAPFPYFVAPRAFDEDVSTALLEWLERDAPWKLVEADFYEQYEFDFLDAELPAHLSFLKERAFTKHVKGRLEDLFAVALEDHVDLTAHKLVAGQRIRVHDDYIPGRETHRLLIQLNRGWRDDDGGLLLFFNSPDSADVHKVFRPTHNSAVGFAISPASHHAVSTIHGGERFTLVYSFYHPRVAR